MKYYISGPMTGIPQHNYPEFNRVASYLRAAGHDVCNPAELDDGDTSKDWDYYLRRDISALVECDAVIVLAGWQHSRGALLEMHVARTLGMPLLTETLKPFGESVCHEADRLVSGDRQQDYGHPLDDFTRTGRIWAAILGLPDVTPEQVALCMVGVKMSRECNHPKRDNAVDGAGYFQTLDMVKTERAKRSNEVE